MYKYLEVFHEYLPRIISGFSLTLEISIISLIFAIIIGFIGANFRVSKNGILRAIGSTYSTIFRGVPDLVWILMIYYSAQFALNYFTELLNIPMIEISPFMAGVFTLSIFFGAFFTETFRGAILSVPRGLLEAGESYGFSKIQVSTRILFPLMMRFAIPGIKNNFLVLTKATALISIIGLEDITAVTHLAGSSTHMQFAFNMLSACLFLIFNYVIMIIFKHIEKHYSRGIQLGETA